MNERVLDASVLLAILKGEPFEAEALTMVEGAIMSTVNLAEVLSKLEDFGLAADPRVIHLLELLKRVEPFSEAQAWLSGTIRESTRPFGLSLGDRACLAAALDLNAEVYTMERIWARVEVGCVIHVLR